MMMKHASPSCFCLLPFLQSLQMIVRIPNLSIDSTFEFKPLAILSSPGGNLVMYWWADQRAVIVNKSMNDSWWLLSGDETIHNSLWTLCCILPGECDDLKARDMKYSEGLTEELRPFDDEMLRQFFDCEWTDFACDGLVIHGTIEMYTAPPEPEAPASPPGQTVPDDTGRRIDRRYIRHT